MVVLLDTTSLIALGKIGDLDVLAVFDSDPLVHQSVREEVTTEPVRTDLKSFCEREFVICRDRLQVANTFVLEAKDILDEDELNGDVAIITSVLTRPHQGNPVGVVSDDRRVRTVARGLGATVAGTIGAIVRNVEEAMSPDEAKDLVRRVDSHGLHMTGELREKAYQLIDEAVENA